MIRRTVLASVLALVLSSCGLASDYLEGPTPVPSASTAAVEPAPAPPAEDPASAFPEWIPGAYGAVSWASLVTGAETRSGILWVSTEIYPDAEGRAVAAPVCAAGLAFLLDSYREDFRGVSVRDVNGKELASC